MWHSSSRRKIADRDDEAIAMINHSELIQLEPEMKTVDKEFFLWAIAMMTLSF